MTRKNYPICEHCGHPMNPAAGDDCDRVFQLPSGELYCPPCFMEYMKDELESNLDAFAEDLGYPVLYTERGAI